MERPNIAKFQERLRGLSLGHGTVPKHVESIRANGLTNEFNYCCVGIGWEFDQECSMNVSFPADPFIDMVYIDPEAHWGPDEYSSLGFGGAVKKYGYEAVLDMLEDCLAGRAWMDDYGEDKFDPRQYNLIVAGKIPPEAIISIEEIPCFRSSRP
jgi:hypothetical protein